MPVMMVIVAVEDVVAAAGANYFSNIFTDIGAIIAYQS
jgi:hypothetical protein